MSGAKAECEALMNSVLPFAKQMLDRHGEFYPYGGAMRANGEIVSVAGYEGREHPTSNDVIRFMKTTFTAAVKNGQYKATALVYDVRATIPSTGEKSDAIAVSQPPGRLLNRHAFPIQNHEWLCSNGPSIRSEG